MDIGSLLIDLKKIDKKSDIKTYLFGSTAINGDGSDIDLLLVYGSKYTVKAILKIRADICILLSKKYKKKGDILVFSTVEAANNGFIHDERCRLIEDESRKI
jgi:predicted nucleotidyltransferase